MDIGPSTSKWVKINNFSKAPTHKTPTLPDDKSNFGLKRSGTFSSAKRSRISVDDYHSSFTDNTNADVNSNSETKTNDGILRRVSNTVSGLFSNSSWSEWLKGPSPLAISDDRQDSFFNSSDTSTSSETKKETRLIQLYPEEGISEAIDRNEVAGLSASQSVSIENSWAPLKNIIPPFKEDQSFISSTPALSSPYLAKRGKDDLLGDPVLLKPSTSNFHSELLPPRDDSVNLKHSFSEALADNHSSQTNGSISTFPTSRKRLRESMEGESNNGDINASVSKKRSLTQSQIFSEDNEESMTRKRPRFSISTYGSPLWNKVPEDEPSFSIFYPGKIMYGGASNHHRKRNRIIPRKICPRTPATISRNDDDHSDGGLSSAARRILDCIDKISTPLSDSKRAFQFCSPRDFSFNSSSFVADFHKNRPTAKLNTLAKDSPPVNKLLTPSKVKITKNFSSLFSSKSNEAETSVKGANYEKKNEECNSDNKIDSSSAKMISQKSSNSFVTKERASNQESFKNSNIRQNSHFVSSNRVSKSSSTYDSSSVSNSIFKVDAQKFNVVNDQKHDLGTFTKGKENISLGAKNTTFDNVDYKFSNPAVVSDLSLLENLPKNSIEFKFSQPINEDELPSSKECFISDSKESGFIIKNNKWNCDTCLLQNDESNIKCAACESPKPQKAKVTESSSLSLAVSQNFGCAFKKPLGSWECETCLLQNKSDQEKCVACFTAKPIKKPKSQDSASDKKLLNYSGNWGESFKRPEGSWDCPKCLLQNKATFNVCASCEAPKSLKSSSGISNSAKTSLNNWGEAFKPSEGSWVCESCLVHNTSNCSNCLCCKAAKPKSENENKTEISPLCFETSKNKTTTKHQDDLKEKENLWICPECLINNNNLEEKCLSCKCSRPTPSNILPKDSKSSLTGSFPSQFLKGKDEWECETCCVRNKITKQKCQSCDTPRARLSHSDIVSEALTGNFKFDSNPKTKTNDSSSTFKFGIASDATKEKFSGFSFGVNPVLSKNEKPSTSSEEIKKSSGFSFGSNTALPMEEKPSNSNLDVNGSKDIKAGFKFGVSSSKDVSVSLEGNSSNGIKSDTIPCGADATSSKNEKLSKPSTEVNKESTKAVATSGFSFGDHVSKTSGFSFGAGSPLSKNDSGNIQLNNPSKASNVENSVTSSILTLQPSNKEPSKSITFDLEGVKSNNENTVDKPATSSVLQVPIESKTSPSTLQPLTSITNPSGALSSSNLIFGVTPASTVSLAPPKNASDSVSTTTTSTTSFSFFKPSVASMTTKLEEKTNNKQESKSKPIFQFGSSNITTQSSETKFEFPKLDNASVKNPNDFFSQGFPKVNPSSFNFFGNSSSAQSVDNKPSIPSFGDTKPAPSFGDSKPPPPFGDSKPPPPFGDTKSLFVFGNNDVKPQNTGFSFGKQETSKATSSVPVFGGFGSPVSQPFKFGQEEPSGMMQTMHKSSETAAPSSFNFDPRQNPFNATTSLGSQKAPRITKKAHRRLNKP